MTSPADTYAPCLIRLKIERVRRSILRMHLTPNSYQEFALGHSWVKSDEKSRLGIMLGNRIFVAGATTFDFDHAFFRRIVLLRFEAKHSREPFRSMICTRMSTFLHIPDSSADSHDQSGPRANDCKKPEPGSLNGVSVAICSVGELFGGVERHILGILGTLRDYGINTSLLLFHDGELAAQARYQGIEPVILHERNRSLFATSRELARVLQQRNVQVVHVHGYKATVYCAIARRRHPFSMVKTEHGLPEPMAGRPMEALRDRTYHLLACLATRMASATVCYVTGELLTYYRRAHSGLRAKVIPNGVANMDRHQMSCPPELREDCFNLAIVGRLDTVKGHHLAIEAVAAEAVPSSVHLQIVGVGPCEPALRALAQARGVAQRVHFLGFRRNIYDYIAHCHALLMPSLHEGLPYTLLEAMALRTPIVASKVGGLEEVLQDGLTALLVPPGDVAALAQAIVRLHDDRELCCQLGEHAQRLQRAQYSLAAMTEHYLSVYRDVLPGAGQPTPKS